MSDTIPKPTKAHIANATQALDSLMDRSKYREDVWRNIINLTASLQAEVDWLRTIVNEGVQSD